MGRPPKAFWSSSNNAWRSDTLTPSGRRRTRYLRGIPFGEKGGPEWQAAQVALAEMLARELRDDPLRPAYKPRPRPEPGEPDEVDDPAPAVVAGPGPGDPSPAEILAALDPLRRKRTGGMVDARGEIDHPARACQPNRPLRRPAPPEPTAADACAAMLRDWRRRTGRARKRPARTA